MHTRCEQRLNATLIPVQVTGLGTLHIQTPGRALDVSRNGLRLAVPEPIPIGSLLRIELEDSIVFGEVRYCQDHESWHAVGLFVEEVLVGESELSRLVVQRLHWRQNV
jgi:hypothetical protein